MDLLAEKQAIFNASADKSVAGVERLELDDMTFGDSIQMSRIMCRVCCYTPELMKLFSRIIHIR